MPLPSYLEENRERIIQAPEQSIFLWNSSYERYRSNKYVDEICRRFPDRNLQRDAVIKLIQEDTYLGLVAVMIWGGINANRPRTKGGADTPFQLFLNHPMEKVLEAVNYAEYHLEKGDIETLFTAFSVGGRHKIPGVSVAYFTKIFYFIAEAMEEPYSIMPLILDKWTANAYCALLICQGGDVSKQFTINRSVPKSLSLPSGTDLAKLYRRYIEDMNAWATELQISPGKLESFIFGLPRNTGDATNPRNQLWEIISTHFGVPRKPDKKSEVRKPNKERKIMKQERTKRSSYEALTVYFNQAVANHITLSTDEIEAIIGRALPPWAFDHAATFWANSGQQYHSHKKAWLRNGYLVSQSRIDAKNKIGEVVFSKKSLKYNQQ